jgi:hypothetical protein
MKKRVLWELGEKKFMRLGGSRHELSNLSVHEAKAEGLWCWVGGKWHYISVVLYSEVEDS